MEIISGNLLEAKESIIIHQTNCMGVMGSGLAKQIKDKYPEVFQGYYHYCKTNPVDKLLGSALLCEANDGKIIANVFGQVNYGTDKRYTDYDALKHALEEVHQYAATNALTIAVPYNLGCGKAGGEWEIVSKMLDEIFDDCTIYKYEG